MAAQNIEIQQLLAAMNEQGANQRTTILSLVAIVQRLEDNNAFLRLFLENNNPGFDIDGSLEQMKIEAINKGYIVNF